MLFYLLAPQANCLSAGITAELGRGILTHVKYISVVAGVELPRPHEGDDRPRIHGSISLPHLPGGGIYFTVIRAASVRGKLIDKRADGRSVRRPYRPCRNPISRRAGIIYGFTCTIPYGRGQVAIRAPVVAGRVRVEHRGVLDGCRNVHRSCRWLRDR